MSDATIEYTESSGNVFADLNLPNPEEALTKAQLAHAISTIIAQRRLTQLQAATLLSIDQPKVSKLRGGHLSGFSVERLLRFLLALQRDVEIVIKPTARAHASGRLHVTVAPHSRRPADRKGTATAARRAPVPA